jgi:hypothetical protein
VAFLFIFLRRVVGITQRGSDVRGRSEKNPNHFRQELKTTLDRELSPRGISLKFVPKEKLRRRSSLQQQNARPDSGLLLLDGSCLRRSKSDT